MISYTLTTPEDSTDLVMNEKTTLWDLTHGMDALMPKLLRAKYHNTDLYHQWRKVIINAVVNARAGAQADKYRVEYKPDVSLGRLLSPVWPKGNQFTYMEPVRAATIKALLTACDVSDPGRDRDQRLVDIDKYFDYIVRGTATASQEVGQDLLIADANLLSKNFEKFVALGYAIPEEDRVTLRLLTHEISTLWNRIFTDTDQLETEFTIPTLDEVANNFVDWKEKVDSPDEVVSITTQRQVTTMLRALSAEQVTALTEPMLDGEDAIVGQMLNELVLLMRTSLLFRGDRETQMAWTKCITTWGDWNNNHTLVS